MSTTSSQTITDTASGGNVIRTITQTITYSLAEYQALLVNTQAQITANTQQATVLNTQVTAMQGVLAQVS